MMDLSNIIGPAISAGASHINQFMQYLSNNRTNNANRDIAREANEWNYRMFQEGNNFNREERLATQAWNDYMFGRQMAYNTSERVAAQAYNTQEREAAQAYNTQMWHAQNAYNSPAAQAERMRAAGLNPSLASLQPGTASSIQSTPASSSGASAAAPTSSPGSSVSPPTAVVPTMIPEYDGSLLNQSITAMVGALGQLESIKGQSIDNESRGARNKAALDNMLEDLINKRAAGKLSAKELEHLDQQIKHLGLVADYQRMTNDRFNNLASQADQMFQREIKLKDQAYQINQLDMSTKQLMIRLAVASNERESAMAAASIQKIKNECENLVKSGRLITAQAVKTELERHGVRLDQLAKSLSLPELQLSAERVGTVNRARHGDDVARSIDNVIHYLTNSISIPIRLK